LNDNANLYIDKIMSASARMSRLITDLLNFSRLRRTPEEFVPTDLNEVLLNVKNDLEVVINNKKATINVHALPVITAIPFQINQLFYNLLSNALKFASKERTPVIDISFRQLSPDEISGTVELSRNRAFCEIVVKDNGIGFNPAYADKIFEIFQRLNDRSDYEGTGIGLALCNKIVLNHNGFIFANAVEDVGAEFHIILPV